MILQFATSASAGVAAPPSTIYVEPSGSEDGSAWGNSFSSIQTAITGANSADEVWVAAGTYTESITMKSGVNVYGGFDNSDTLLNDRDHETNVTIIDASSLAAASKYHVVTFSSVTAILDGFTITGGAAAGSSSDQEGGGIYLVSADDSEINNCIITANSAIGAGAGIYGTDSSITISNCVISNNVATSSGGGIMFESDSASIITGSRIVGNYSGYEGGGINIDTNSGFDTTITDSTIAGNESVNGGGGIFAYSANSTIERCIVSGNISGTTGGGIHIDFPLLIQNCMITGNTAADGGAIYANSDSSLINNTIAGNTASTSGGEIYFFSNAANSHVITNNIFYNNTNYAIYEAGVDADPVVTYNTFRDNTVYEYYDEGDTDRHASPQIDALSGNGDNNNQTVGFETVSSLTDVYGNYGTSTWSNVGTYDSTTNTTTLTITGPTFTTDQWVGRMINTDTSQLLESYIVSNTSNTITVYGDVDDPAFAVIGDTYAFAEYHIKSNSNQRTLGTATGAPSVDYEGETRSTPDIGADEFYSTLGTTTSDYANLDDDNDGLSDVDEAANGPDQFDPDSDDDGYGDGFEVAAGTDPNNPSNTPTAIYVDVTAIGSNNGTSFDDAFTSLQEGIDNVRAGGEVWVADGTYQETIFVNHGDGLSDYAEINIYGTDENDEDTDDDGLSDGYEIENGKDPLVTNTVVDSDGVTNVDEIALGSDVNRFEIWVDYSHFGTESGTATEPFDTLDEALAACPADGAIRLQLPNYSTWTGTIDQAVGLNADGGTATLGGPPI